MFVQQMPQPFNSFGVSSLAPGYTGVYGIFRQNVWVYIGKGNIKERLTEHLRNSFILAQGPTHFVTELWLDPHMSNREKQLILACRPLCNLKVG